MHPDFLRSPETVCDPDPRTNMVYVPKDIRAQHAEVERFVFSEAVPEKVRIQFETAKNLFLYSWFVYRFYPIAKHQALICLELALHIRFEEEMLEAGCRKRPLGFGLSKMLTFAIEQGYVGDADFGSYHRIAETRARHRKMLEDLEEMQRLGLESMDVDDGEVEVKEADFTPGYANLMAEGLSNTRNRHAHGIGGLDKQVLGTFQAVFEIVNKIYK